MQIAPVAELVDAHGSGPCAARCGGSNPSVGTITAKDKAESLENMCFRAFLLSIHFSFPGFFKFLLFTAPFLHQNCTNYGWHNHMRHIVACIKKGTRKTTPFDIKTVVAA